MGSYNYAILLLYLRINPESSKKQKKQKSLKSNNKILFKK